MGLDFIEKRKKSFTAKWDRARVQLSTADLLTRSPVKAGCSAAFDMAARAQFNKGENVVVEYDGSGLVVRKGLSVVARAHEPPPQVLRAVQESCGSARGTISHVHDISGVAEILLC